MVYISVEKKMLMILSIAIYLVILFYGVRLNDSYSSWKHVDQSKISNVTEVMTENNTEVNGKNKTYAKTLKSACGNEPSISSKELNTQQKEEVTIRERYSCRKDLLKDTCGRISRTQDKDTKEGTDATLRLQTFSYYIADKRLLACLIPKAGMSTWKIHLLRMVGYFEYTKYPNADGTTKRIGAKNVLRRRRETVNSLLSPSVVRVVSVRHPIDRLISAYSHKLYNGRPHTLGTTYFSKYMKKALTIAGVKFKLGDRVSVSFRMFINMVLQDKKGGLENLDVHWRPQYILCNPCSWRYDYVVKQETFAEDLSYLIKTLKIKHIDVGLKRNPSKKPSNVIYEDYFKDIPEDSLKEIFQLYKQDFIHFGYEIPKIFVKFLEPGM